MTTYNIDYQNTDNTSTIQTILIDNNVAFVSYPSINRVTVFSTLNPDKGQEINASLWRIKSKVPGVSITVIKGLKKATQWGVNS